MRFDELATLLTTLVLIISAIALLEHSFRRWYRRNHGKDLSVPVKYRWDEQYICSHPNFSVAHIPGSVLKHRQIVPYPFNRKCFSMTDTQVINNAGYQSHRDYFFEKNPKTLRVAYLGNSTVANILSDGKRDYSVPVLTEERLQSMLGPKKVDCEVYNFATMGWVSTDLVACMALHVVHYKPDVVVLYHGFTDLYLYLTDESEEAYNAVFRHDYTHNRRNLGVTIAKHWIVNKLVPRIPWLWCYEYFKSKTCGTGDLRNEFMSSMRTHKINSTRKYIDMRPRKEHMRTILTLCAALDIPVVIPAFCCANLDHSRVGSNIEAGIQIENTQMKELSEEFRSKGHRVWFLDGTVKGNILYDIEQFCDWVHFAPKGMECFADLISTFIAEKVGADIAFSSRLKAASCG